MAPPVIGTTCCLGSEDWLKHTAQAIVAAAGTRLLPLLQDFINMEWEACKCSFGSSKITPSDVQVD